MSKVQSERVHLEYLDGIRGLALILVMLFHAELFPRQLKTYSGSLPFWLEPIVRHGAVGVDLFFVLSGFLITGILLRSRSQANYFSNFYARRALRILPLYYLASAVWAVVSHYWHEPELTEGQGVFWPWVLTFTTNLLVALKEDFMVLPRALQHFWSLAIEEQFYLLWPALVFFLSRKALLRVSVGFIFLAPALRFAFSYRGWIQSYVFTFARFDGLAMGALLALMLEDARALRWIRRAMLPGFLLYLLSEFGPLRNYGIWLSFSAINVFFVGLLATTLDGRFTKTFFQQRWLAWFGRRSYGAYVIHQPFIIAACLLIPWLKDKPPVLFLIVPFLCMPLTELSWRLWEQPFLRLKRYFESRGTPTSS